LLVTRKEKRPRVGRLGLDWAALAGLQLGQFRSFQRKGVGLPWWAGLKTRRAIGKILSNFLNKDLILKTKDSNTFKPNLNWN
jgi:hypothetical protein